MYKAGFETAESRWKGLYKVGGAAALLMVALIPIQILVFVVWPPPGTVTGWFMLFQSNWFLGLLSFDLLYMLQSVLLVLVYLALYASLRRAGESFMAVALALGLVGIAAYFASNTAFEMLSLSEGHAVATTDAQRSMFLAAGQAMLATYKGTAFDVYYVLNAGALLLISVVMLRGNIFGRVTAYAGLLAGVLMIVPSTVGAVGLTSALASLLPWTVFSGLIARRLFRIAGHIEELEPHRP